MSDVQFPIDAVITWVDGDDVRHKAKLAKYGNQSLLGAEDVAGTTRFANVGEIFYCVASLYQYAPWLNKIYIVTDEQDPQLNDFIHNHFPNRHIPIVIVDHKEIFQGYEQYLPTFNSISIESMTWRIPGLSEHYIEFNDDLFLAAPTTPEDFFTPDGKQVVCYGKYRPSFWVRLTRMLKNRSNGIKKVTYKETMLNAATHAGYRHHFIELFHTPKALLKSVYADFYQQNPYLLVHNIQHRFRCASQYNPQETHFMLLYNQGRCILRNASDYMIYMKAKTMLDYNIKKLKIFNKHPNHQFGCVNSLDLACPNGQKMILEWIERRIKLK